MSQRKWKGQRRKRSRRSKSASVNAGLEERVAETGGRLGYGLESSVDHDDNETKNRAGIYSSRSVSTLSSVPRLRDFKTKRKDKTNGTTNKSTTTALTSKAVQDDASMKSTATPKNPYSNGDSSSRRPMTSCTTTQTSKTSRPNRAGLRSGAMHVVCAISENLAKETCVTSLDAGSPTSLLVTKQGNGQTYAETLSYLEILQPDEILLNEGRRNSQLAKKVLAMYNQTLSTENPIDADRNRRREAKRKSTSRRSRHFAASSGAPPNGNDVFDSDDDGGGELPQGVGLAGPCGTSTVVKFVPRAYFDQTAGAELLQRVARPDTYDPSLIEEYILLSSAHAVLLYTQLCLGANFARNSLHLSVNAGGNNRMNIDRSSLLHLELLANAKTGKSANSLIGTIDCTKTTVGSRLLRTNLMAPPMRVETINTRLDLVDTFLGDEEFFYTVLDHLEALPDVDKMLINVALIPWKRGKKRVETPVTARVASKGISALVCIKSILGAMPAFAGALEDQLMRLEARENAQNANGGTVVGNDNVSTITDGSLLIGLGTSSNYGAAVPHTALRYQLLRAIVTTMKHAALPQVLDAILDIFVESTTFSRNAHAMRHQECFALKPKTDGMMDLIRKAFLANVDDIYKLADEYAESFGIKVAVKETASRGYYLAVPSEIAAELPQVFIQPVKSGRFIHCTTEEVHSLNARAQENVQDLLMLTHERIQEVLDIARCHYDALASLSDAIALLDMCHCFADNVASSRDCWCRPIVSDDSDPAGGEISIINGRYGIDTSKTGLTSETGSYIPNDTHSSRSKHFTVITGVNGSGKSFYLKQIAILVVMSHCGSYVPAEKAIIPIRDRICTRIGTADDQEHNISTFMLEMKEAAFICKHATEKSLILVDELGRATSNEDGVAIAWAVSEHLLSKRAMTFFVTHYPQLSKLSLAYPAVQNMHMNSTVSGEDNSELCYTHKIRLGPCKMTSDYGVDMAPTCGWPGDVVKEARRIRCEIESLLPDASLCLVESNAAGSNEASETLLMVAERLREFGAIFNRESFDVEAARSALEKIRVDCTASGDPGQESALMKHLAHDPSEGAESKNGANCPEGTSYVMQSRNVVSQGQSEIIDLSKVPNEDYDSDSTGSTLSSSDSDSSSSSSSGSETD